LAPYQNSTVIYPPVLLTDNVTLVDLSNKKNIILSVGRFFVGAHSKKQFELVKFFLKNQDELSDYELHLVGGLSDNEEDQQYVRSIKSLINEREDRVFLHVNASYVNLKDLYEKSKFFGMPLDF
jgi:glycosyltransferase involved in cell wall biosynthesis